MSENTNTERDLGFFLENRDGIWVVQDSMGGCSPASVYEQKLWTAYQEARASLSLPAAGQEPYCWTVSGGHSMFRGKYAKQDALNEAKQCGGTAVALPLYAALQPAVAAGWVMPLPPASSTEGERDANA